MIILLKWKMIMWHILGVWLGIVGGERFFIVVAWNGNCTQHVKEMKGTRGWEWLLLCQIMFVFVSYFWWAAHLIYLHNYKKASCFLYDIVHLIIVLCVYVFLFKYITFIIVWLKICEACVQKTPFISPHFLDQIHFMLSYFYVM